MCKLSLYTNKLVCVCLSCGVQDTDVDSRILMNIDNICVKLLQSGIKLVAGKFKDWINLVSNLRAQIFVPNTT